MSGSLVFYYLMWAVFMLGYLCAGPIPHQVLISRWFTAQRGTAMAIYFMAMYLCGASFGPLLTGKLSDLMARRAADAAGALRVTEAFKAIGLQQAMFIIPILSLLLAVVNQPY